MGNIVPEKKGDTLNSSQPYIDDPTATYRGFRRQSLYALFRLFNASLPADFAVQPEGEEDVAILDEAGKLVEVVQVKDYSGNLTASTFKPSWFHRIARHCEPGLKVNVRVASFGPIGPELAEALDNTVREIPKRVLDTITKDREVERKQPDGTKKKIKVPGLEKDKAENVLRHIEVEQVDEDTLTSSIIDQLKLTLTSGDPHSAFHNLMWWMLTSSENQTKLTRARAVAKIEEIGRFLSHRAAHQHEWHTSIIPIREPDVPRMGSDDLKAEFFRGGRVRFDHISENIDVPRSRFLVELHSLFQHDNVTILHAASGQGKTTLAYRYIHDCAPSDFRFEVRSAANLQHARRLVAAIAGHSEAFNVPTLVYLDVRPGDNLWFEIVRELSAVPAIRVLVTIREEDWSRARITQADFTFAEMTLSFEEDEAQEVYDRLSDEKENAFLDFSDAWSQFGPRKTLFEFVYFVTQEETLSQRITAQVKALQDSANRQEIGQGEVQLLRLAAVASAFEARLTLAPVAAHCSITEPMRTVERFNNEYLIRRSEDGQYVEGFHAIRSEIICNQLIDPELSSWKDAASECLPFINEDDVESFLLCAFSRHPEATDTLVATLQHFVPSTWVGIRGVSVALMWNGLKDYVALNADLLDEAVSQFNSGWQCILDWDLAKVRGEDGINVFGSLRNSSEQFTKAAEATDQFRQRQTDKTSIYDLVGKWLEQLTTPKKPSDVADFVALSEMLYWIGHLRIKTQLRECVTVDLISSAFDILPIHLFGEFALAVQAVDSDCYHTWLSAHSDGLVEAVRKRAGIMALVEEEHAYVAHYAIDLDRKASALRSEHKREDYAHGAINELSVERVTLLRQCLPGKTHYGATGYGHRMSLIGSHGDDSVKRMPVENIVMPWLPSFNSLARGLVEYRFRPESWDDYLKMLRDLREQILAAFDDLQQATRVADGRQLGLRDTQKWDDCMRCTGRQYLFPRSSVDEWGFVSESSGKSGEQKAQEMRFTGPNRLRAFNDAVREYTRTVGNFMQQALEAVILVPHLRKAQTSAAKTAILQKARELNVNENSIRLSVINGIDACSAIEQLQRSGAECFGDSAFGVSEQFNREERNNFRDTMRAWCLLTHPHEVKQRTRGAKRRKQRARRKLEFVDIVKPTRNRIKAELSKLKSHDIKARILDEKVIWDGQSALWITCNSEHPLSSLVAIEKIWFALVRAFEPDRDKIARIKAIDLVWSNIILVPLISGKSLESQALPYLKAVTYPEVPNIEDHPWRLFPAPVPDEIWDELGLECWGQHPSWPTFDRFTEAYGLLFHHVDHMSDFNRCTVDLDESGESILLKYLAHETARAQPYLQETFDSCGDLLSDIADLPEEELAARPNLIEAMNFLVGMKEAIYPTADFAGQVRMPIEEVVEWRDRLKVGLENLGLARQLWVADSLGFPAFQEEDSD